MRAIACAAPALLALLAAFFGGPAAGFPAMTVGAWYLGALLVALVFAIAHGLRPAAVGVLDPLGLVVRGEGAGRRWRWSWAWLPWALVAWVGISWLASPLPRAGRTVVLVLPALLLLPAALARLVRWGGDRAAVSFWTGAALLTVSAVALVQRWQQGLEKAADPLGHHISLALWILPLLPVALVGARRPGVGRWMAILAGIAGVAALAASRSLAGFAGFAVVATLAVAWLAGGASGGGRRRWRALLVPALVLVAVAPRLVDIARGNDVSSNIRLSYWSAGIEGVVQRPLVGWGPGATPWMLRQHLTTVPGVHPPGQLIGDLHSLPVALLYELGVPALVMALLLLIVFARRRLEATVDPLFTSAALGGLWGFAVASLGSAPLVHPSVWLGCALPLALALVADGHRVSPQRTKAPTLTAAATVLAVVLAAVLLWPTWSAHRQWDSHAAVARAEGGAGAEGQSAAPLVNAHRHDPSFPLYAAAVALEADDADALLAAANAAPGVTPLWIAAGEHLARGGDPRAGTTLMQACALDPLVAAPSLFLALLDPASPTAGGHLARALLADPRLAAATALVDQPRLLEDAHRRIQRDDGVDAGWRLAFAEALDRRQERLVAAGPPSGFMSGSMEGLGEVLFLELVMDSDGLSTSYFLFRRTPAPTLLAQVPLASGLLEAFALSPPAQHVTTTTARLTAADCWSPAP